MHREADGMGGAGFSVAGFRWVLLLVLQTALGDVSMVPVRGEASTNQEDRVFARFQNGEGTAEDRKAAEDLLKANPQSIAGLLVLGKYYYSVGEFARASWEFRLAERRLDATEASDAVTILKTRRYRAVLLLAQADCCRMLDRLQEEVVVLESYLKRGFEERESQWDIHVGGRARLVYALCKCGETARAGLVLDETPKARQDDVGYREERVAVTFFRHPDGLAAYQEHRQLVASIEDGKLDHGILMWQAFLARRVGDYDGCERCLLEASASVESKSGFNPQRELALLYTADANWVRARGAVAGSWDVLAGKSPNLRQELRKDSDVTLAAFYLVTGYPDRSLSILIPRAADPMRLGYTTATSEAWRAGLDLLLLAARHDSAQLRREAVLGVAEESLARRASQFVGSIALRSEDVFDEWEENRCLRADLIIGLDRKGAKRDLLSLVDAPVWLWFQAARSLGASDFGGLLRARPLEGADERQFRRYLEVLRCWMGGDWAGVERLVPQAIQSLPDSRENEIRAELYILYGEAKRRLGKRRDALTAFAKGYQLNAAIFRSLEIKLPVRLSMGNVPSKTCFLRSIGLSPRLESDGWGFELSFQELSSGNLRVSLAAPSEGLLREFVLHSNPGSAGLGETAAAESFYRQMFSPIPPLFSVDQHKLEGRAVQSLNAQQP